MRHLLPSWLLVLSGCSHVVLTAPPRDADPAARDGVTWAGLGVAVLGTATGVIGGAVAVGNTDGDRLRCFDTYEDDLARYLFGPGSGKPGEWGPGPTAPTAP